MLAAGTKVKIGGSEEKKKANLNTYDISKQRQRNVQKSVLHVQSCFFFLIRLIVFFLPFSLPSPFQVMLHGTIRRTLFSATQRCIIVATLFRMVAALFQYCNTLF